MRHAAATTKRETEVSMSTTGESPDSATDAPEVGTIDMKLEVVTLPVSDVDPGGGRRRHRRGA
jgi:hypothetical protein